MPEWLSDFVSPKWWASVFAAGIIMNMLSRHIDARLVFYAKGAKHWWSDRAQLRAMVREQLIDEFVHNAVARASMTVSSMYWSFIGLASFLCALAAMVNSEALLNLGFGPTIRVAMLVIVCVSAALSFIAMTRLLRASHLLREAASRARSIRLDAESGAD